MTRKILGWGVAWAIALGVLLLAFGNEYEQGIADNYVSVTNSPTSTIALRGLVDTVIIEGASRWTGTVTIVAGPISILTASDITGTNVYRPRVVYHTITGTAMTSTNECIMLQADYVTYTVACTSTTTNDVTVRIRTREY